jgi:hypothetical protein
VPTGSPLRQLILNVRVESSDGRHFEEQRVYRRTVADQRGETLTQEHLTFIAAVKQVGDSRLAPGEQRTESFSFGIPADTESRITAALQYFYSPFGRTEAQKQITFLKLTRIVQ